MIWSICWSVLDRWPFHKNFEFYENGHSDWSQFHPNQQHHQQIERIFEGQRIKQSIVYKRIKENKIEIADIFYVLWTLKSQIRLIQCNSSNFFTFFNLAFILNRASWNLLWVHFNMNFLFSIANEGFCKIPEKSKGVYGKIYWNGMKLSLY